MFVSRDVKFFEDAFPYATQREMGKGEWQNMGVAQNLDAADVEEGWRDIDATTQPNRVAQSSETHSHSLETGPPINDVQPMDQVTSVAAGDDEIGPGNSGREIVGRLHSTRESIDRGSDGMGTTT